MIDTAASEQAEDALRLERTIRWALERHIGLPPLELAQVLLRDIKIHLDLVFERGRKAGIDQVVAIVGRKP